MPLPYYYVCLPTVLPRLLTCLPLSWFFSFFWFSAFSPATCSYHSVPSSVVALYVVTFVCNSTYPSYHYCPYTFFMNIPCISLGWDADWLDLPLLRLYPSSCCRFRSSLRYTFGSTTACTLPVPHVHTSLYFSPYYLVGYLPLFTTYALYRSNPTCLPFPCPLPFPATYYPLLDLIPATFLLLPLFLFPVYYIHMCLCGHIPTTPLPIPLRSILLATFILLPPYCIYTWNAVTTYNCIHTFGPFTTFDSISYYAGARAVATYGSSCDAVPATFVPACLPRRTFTYMRIPPPFCPAVPLPAAAAGFLGSTGLRQRPHTAVIHTFPRSPRLLCHFTLWSRMPFFARLPILFAGALYIPADAHGHHHRLPAVILQHLTPPPRPRFPFTGCVLRHACFAACTTCWFYLHALIPSVPFAAAARAATFNAIRSPRYARCVLRTQRCSLLLPTRHNHTAAVLCRFTRYMDLRSPVPGLAPRLLPPHRIFPRHGLTPSTLRTHTTVRRFTPFVLPAVPCHCIVLFLPACCCAFGFFTFLFFCVLVLPCVALPFLYFAVPVLLRVPHHLPYMPLCSSLAVNFIYCAFAFGTFSHTTFYVLIRSLRSCLLPSMITLCLAVTI